jgi:hypothetical protein
MTTEGEPLSRGGWASASSSTGWEWACSGSRRQVLARLRQGKGDEARDG